MAVFRIEKTRDYTVMSNHHLKDLTLTLKSKGLERQAQAEKEVKAIVQKAKARAAGTAGGKTSGKAHRRRKA